MLQMIQWQESHICETIEEQRRLENVPCRNIYRMVRRENNGGANDMQTEKYHVLIEKLNSFKQEKHENAHDMFSCLNVLINKINALGLKDIVDDE